MRAGGAAIRRTRAGARRRTAALAVLPCAAMLLVAGCTSTVEGQASAAGQTGGPGGEQYRDLLSECTIVPREAIARIVGAPGVIETFSGAVCRWRSIDGAVDVQLDWFETGSMSREKAVAENLGYRVQNVRISGSVAYVLHPPHDASSCGAVAAAAGGAGIVGWWVHASPADPCEAAKELVKRSVGRAL